MENINSVVKLKKLKNNIKSEKKLKNKENLKNKDKIKKTKLKKKVRTLWIRRKKKN